MTTITASSPTTYALDNAWHAERERLDSLTRLFDAGTLEICDRLGLSDGWSCLEVGAGTGTLAAAMAERTAPTGRVLAVDLNTRFLDPIASERLRVLRADIATDALPEREFDLVHARLLLEHVPQRDAVLPRLAAAVKPGGWLLVEDFDWSTALVVDPPSATHERVVNAVMDAFAAHGYDRFYGRRLPRGLDAAGLIEIGTRAESTQVRADAAAGVPQWELLVDQLAPAMIAAGLLDDGDIERFHALWHDGDTVSFPPLLVRCWGRRPVQ
jgi:ubiquinone/menaquinone biosynthesis C-methylase UbiE